MQGVSHKGELKSNLSRVFPQVFRRVCPYGFSTGFPKGMSLGFFRRFSKGLYPKGFSKGKCPQGFSKGMFQKGMSTGISLEIFFVIADFFWRKTERLSELLAHGLITVTYVPTSRFSLVRKQLSARAAS